MNLGIPFDWKLIQGILISGDLWRLLSSTEVILLVITKFSETIIDVKQPSLVSHHQIFAEQTRLKNLFNILTFMWDRQRNNVKQELFPVSDVICITFQDKKKTKKNKK